MGKRELAERVGEEVIGRTTDFLEPGLKHRFREALGFSAALPGRLVMAGPNYANCLQDLTSGITRRFRESSQKINLTKEEDVDHLLYLSHLGVIYGSAMSGMFLGEDPWWMLGYGVGGCFLTSLAYLRLQRLQP